MNCMNCGASVMKSAEYCPKCGFHVLSQRKAVYLSKLYYNQGLEKATVRDLSGAITCLKQSLKYNKSNIDARNLLGLVYFETGEVVASLCEWVISKNLRPRNNLATEYIERLQANPSKLDTINRTVNKYNLALSYCREGNEDLAVIQLKKLLVQNPHLIKGYHLLALLQIREGSYSKARKTLKKALKIDKTNTTTLRFLKEVDEQTGMTTDLNGKTRRLKLYPAETENKELIQPRRVFQSGNDLVILPPVFRESHAVGFFLNLLLGIAIGAAALWFLVVPAIRQNIYDTVNEEMKISGSTLNSQAARIEQLESDAEEANQNTSDAQAEVSAANMRVENTDKLMLAYQSLNQGDTSSAASYLQTVSRDFLSEQGQALYDVVHTSLNLPSETPAPGTENGSGDGGNDSGYDSSQYEDGQGDYDSGYDSSY